MSDALAHLDAAIAALCLEAYRGRDPESMSPVEHFTIGEDLKRIDSAIGPTGESVFARIADNIEAAYVELLAARALIAAGPPAQTRVQAPEDFEEKLSDFLEALDEWGCDDNAERAREILEFQRTGYDLDAYLVEHPDRPKSELN